VRYFETKVDAYPQPDALGIPESFFIFSSSFIVFDMRTPTTEVKIVTLCIVDDNLDSNYADAVKEIDLLETKLRTSKPRDFPTLPVSNTCVPSHFNKRPKTKNFSLPIIVSELKMLENKVINGWLEYLKRELSVLSIKYNRRYVNS